MNLYASPGKILNNAILNADYDAGNAETLQYPLSPIIPDSGVSEGFPVNDADEFSLQIKYESAPSGSTIIEMASDPRFTDATTLDTILTGSYTLKNWTTEAQINGFIRVSNTSGVSITEIRAQKRTC